MIIRMARWSARPGTDEESRELWSSTVGPIWRRQPGLVLAHLLTSPGSDQGITLSVWGSVEDYERFVSSADLPLVVEAYDHIYAPNGRPEAEKWSILTYDWDIYD